MKIRNQAKRQRQSYGENDMITEAGDDPKPNGPVLSGSEAQALPVTLVSSVAASEPYLLITTTSESQTSNETVFGSHMISPSSEELINISDDECLNRIRVCLLEGINGVGARMKEKDREHDKTVNLLEKLKTNYKTLEFTNIVLSNNQKEAEIANKDLTNMVNKLTDQNTNLLLVNKYLEKKSEDAISQRIEAVKALETTTRKYDLVKTSLSNKLADMHIVNSEREVKIATLEGQVSFLKEEAAGYRERLEQAVEDNMWLLKEGVPFCFRSILLSNDFRRVYNPIRLGIIKGALHRRCLEMKKIYPDVEPDISSFFFYPHAHKIVLEAFSDLVRYEFPLFLSLKSGETTIGTLKSLAENSKKECHVEGSGVSDKETQLRKSNLF